MSCDTKLTWEYKDESEMNIIASYKVRSFMGFVPCFDNGLFTLATCKPRLRKTLGKKYEENKQLGGNLTEWVLGVVAKTIEDSAYEDRIDDILFVAKITDVVKYSDYYSETDQFDRKDRIYRPDPDGALKDAWSDQRFGHVTANVSRAHLELSDCKKDWLRRDDKKEQHGEAYVLESTEYTIVSKDQSEQIVSLISETPNGKLIGRYNNNADRGHTYFECPDDAPLVKLLQSIVSSANDHGFALLPADVRVKKTKTGGCGGTHASQKNGGGC